MDRRRAAGALLALAACVAYAAAAPTANEHTSLDIYTGAEEGCYYNFQHYGEGDRIMTNEPCLNCTCHNRMLMCYLRVCPFTKPIGQDCTVEKRADQCCPIVTCPDVPVDLLTSTSTSSPMEYGATGLGKLDMYGCSINGRYFPEGSKVPSTPNKPCEHCYCIRNMTTCVMQECTLHVDGCTPIYHKDVCCPVRYSCDHPEDEIPLLDDMTTTVRPTQGFLLSTTTLSPVTQMTQDCVHEDKIFPDGALIKTEKACEHCYCMKGDIVCVVQECGTPMENEGKNCTSLPPREGQCCPDTYICDGDDLATGITEMPTRATTDVSREDITALPPKIVGSEGGSGYTEESYTDIPLVDSGIEGSGEEDLDKLLSSSTKLPLFDESFETSKDTFDQHPITAKPQSHDMTTESDNVYNTISSEISEEKDTEPLSFKTTVSSDGSKVTESTTIKVGKPVEIEESATNIPDLTTEKSFRKDDQGEVTKESFTQKEFDESVTVSTEQIKVSESTAGYENNASSEKTEEKSTSTLTPTRITIEEATTDSKELFTKFDEKPVNEPTMLDEISTTVAVSESNDHTEPSAIDQEESLTTIYPGRIPGEGDCLYNGVSYRNESNVPSSNKCDLSCKCVSSIVRCDPIICSPAPEFMDNCQAVYDTPESCCPTYICQSKETVPPQSHSQMSGTDKPLTECKNGDCLVTKEKEQHTESEKELLHCDDNENCIKTNITEEAPCKGESCTKVKSDCHSTDCETSEINKNPEDIVKEECLDEICRKQDSKNSESKPSPECADSECLKEVSVIPTAKPDVSTIKPILTESITELSSDKYSTEGDLSHETSDLSIKEKEKSTESIPIKPYPATETYDFVQTTSQPIDTETANLNLEENPVISHTTKVSTAGQSFATTENPEVITVKTNSENDLILSETTPSDYLDTHITVTPETIKHYEPETQTDSLDIIDNEAKKPVYTDENQEYTKNTDIFVTESEPTVSTILGENSKTESPLSDVAQFEYTKPPQEASGEFVTKPTINEEPDTNPPGIKIEVSKTPEISTELPKSVTNYEEYRDLTTKEPEETALENMGLSTEYSESSTPIKVSDEVVTELPEQATSYRISTESSENVEHPDEGNEIPTKIPDYKVTTDSYQKPLIDIQTSQTPEFSDKEKDFLSTTSEKVPEKDYTTELFEKIETTSKSLTPQNEIYTETPEIISPTEIEVETEKAHRVTNTPQEEENEIPTESSEQKVTDQENKLPSILTELTNENEVGKTDHPETVTLATEDLHQLKQHEQIPEYPVHSEVEYSTDIQNLEHTTYEPLLHETVGFESSEELDTHTELPQSSVSQDQEKLSVTEIHTEMPQILISEIPEVIKNKDQEGHDTSTEKQSPIPEIPEVPGTFDYLPVTQSAVTEIYDIPGKENEESVTNINEQFNSISDMELGITTSKPGSTLMETVHPVSDDTLPHYSPELSSETPEYGYKTTVAEVESQFSPVAGVSTHQDSRTDATEKSISQEIYTTEQPTSDIKSPIEMSTDISEPELITAKPEKPEYATENIQPYQTENPQSSSTFKDNTVVEHEVTHQETQTEQSPPSEAENTENLSKVSLEMVTEHLESSMLPVTGTPETILPTYVEKDGEPETPSTEQQQTVNEIETTSETYLKELTVAAEDSTTTENQLSVEIDRTKQYEIQTESPDSNDFINNLPEVSTEEHELSRVTEYYPSSSVTETLPKITDTENETPEKQMENNTPSSKDESPITAKPEVSEEPAITSVNYDEKATTDKYEAVTKPQQQIDEVVTSVPVNVLHEDETQEVQTTPKIKEFSTESQTELPMSMVTETNSKISLPPSEIAETLSPEITMTPEQPNDEQDRIVPSTEIPSIEQEFSTKYLEESHTASPDFQSEIDNTNSDQESITSLPHITQGQEINKVLPQDQTTEVEQYKDVTQSPINHETVPSVNRITEIEDTGEIADNGVFTEMPVHITESADMITESPVDMQTESLSEAPTEKPFVSEPLKTVQPVTVPEVTSLTSEASPTKISEENLNELQEDVTEANIPGVIIHEQLPTEKVKHIETTPYSVELDEHTHADTEPVTPALQETQENTQDTPKPQKTTESEYHEISTTESDEMLAHTNPHSINDEFSPIVPGKQETDEYNTAIPETEKNVANMIPVTSDTLESHTTGNPLIEKVEEEKYSSYTESTVEIEKDIIKMTERPSGSSTLEPSIPDEELILVTTKLTTSKIDEQNPTQSPIETYTYSENEITEDKSTEIPEVKVTEKPEVAVTEQPNLIDADTENASKVQDEYHSEIPQEKPTAIPVENLGGISEEKSTESATQKYTELPEEKPTEASLEISSVVTEHNETPENKPTEGSGEIPNFVTERNETPEKKPTVPLEVIPTEIPEESSSPIPEETPSVINNNVISEIPDLMPTITSEEKFSESPKVSEKPTSEESDVISEGKGTEASTGKPSEIFEEIPITTSGEKVNEIPGVNPTEIYEENFTEPTETKPSETAVKVPEENPNEVLDQNPTEIPKEKPDEMLEETFTEPSQQTSESLHKQPVEIPEERPNEMSSEKPAEIPEDRPSEMSSEKPSEIPEERPSETSSEKSSEITEAGPNETSSGKPSNIPEERPNETSSEKPSEIPEEGSSETSSEKPNDVPEEGSSEISSEKPSEIPKEIPSEMSSQKPSVIPQEPVQTSEEMPNEMSETPSQVLEEKPSELPEQKPSEAPEEEVSNGGYGQEPDYVEEDQAFGPGTCRYGGKVYVSAQQIPRDDPCDFCFCFRSDIICLQQSCPPPIHGCHEEPIQGFCCPRYECPVSMATTLNVTTTTTTTTTTLPPHFPTHAYKGAAQRKGCLIKGHTYKVGEVVRASSGPCLHCTCGGDGQMKCDPKACTPEPMLRQMIAAAVSSKRRR